MILECLPIWDSFAAYDDDLDLNLALFLKALGDDQKRPPDMALFL